MRKVPGREGVGSGGPGGVGAHWCYENTVLEGERPQGEGLEEEGLRGRGRDGGGIGACGRVLVGCVESCLGRRSVYGWGRLAEGMLEVLLKAEAGEREVESSEEEKIEV